MRSPSARSALITMCFHVTASILQPLIGLYTDRRPLPYSLPLAPAFTLLGLVLLAFATSYPAILVAAGAVGIGSAIFHPEASRVARIASGGRYGMAQSLFQVGGNIGTSLGPLLAAWIILPRGQASMVWFGFIAMAAIGILSGVGRWYSHHLRPKNIGRSTPVVGHNLSSRTVSLSLMVLLALMFSKFVYTSAFSSFYTFYLIDHFQVPVKDAQIYLFVYLGAFAVGHLCRRPHWRPHRAQGGDLVFHSRRPALHAGAALREFVLDGGAHRSHWPYPRLGLFRHGGLCAGAFARTRRHDFRAVLRHRLWHCRP